jgi:hypothetical protein
MAWALAALLLPVTQVEGQSADGQELADRIAATLKESGQLSGYRVGVQCEDGVVWLHGTVTDKKQLQSAIALTEQVDGVQHVVSKLEIMPVAPKAAAPTPRVARESEPSLRMAALEASIEGPASSRPVASRPSVRPAAAASPTGRGAMPMPLGQAQADAVRQASFAGSGVQPASCGPGCGPGGFGGYGGFGGVPGASGYVPGATGGVVYDNAQMPAYSWPSYAAYPNYAALTYPQQYSPTAWPYIGPFYPYPQVPLGWRRVTLEWDDGWWWLDFSHRKCH